MKFLLALLLACSSVSGFADDLDKWFELLSTAESTEEAFKIEQNIWAYWLTDGSEKDNAAMENIVALMARNQLSEALTATEALIQSSPEFAEAWNKKATLLFMQGDLFASMSAIEQTIVLEPRHFGAWSGLGLILEQLGQIDGAIKAHREVLKFYPQSEFAQQKIEALGKQLSNKRI